MIEEIQYSPVAFDNIVPVLDVGDPSDSFMRSVQFSTNSLKEQFQADRDQFLQNVDVQNKNIDKDLKDLENLAELSSEAAKKFDKFRQERLDQKMSEIWATNFIEGADIDEEKLYAEYDSDEQAQTETAQVVGEGVAENLNKIDNPSTQQVAAAARLRKYGNLESIVAANAKAAAAMDSYGPALAKFLNKVQPEPGEATERTITEFNERWAQATGMAGANPGFTAKHVYPKLRREAAAENDVYTRGWNAAESAKTRDMLQQGLANGDITLSSYFTQARGLTKADGKTLMNNDDIWNSLNGRFTPAQLSRMGAENFAVTGQSYASHPRFQKLMTEARGQQNRQYELYRAESRQIVQTEFNTLGPNATKQQMETLRRELLGRGLPTDIVDNGLTRALRSSAEAQIERQEGDRVQRWVDANPGKQIPPEVIGNAPYAVRQRFSSLMSESAQSETASELIRDTQVFKDFSKDFKATIKGVVGPTMKVFSTIKGTTDPANYNEFKSEALTDIVNRARGIMLNNPGMKEEDAFKEARDSWIKDATARQKAKELYDGKNNRFNMGDQGGVDFAQDQARELISRANIEKLPEVLSESDYKAPVDGRYSARVNVLAGQFGITPKELIDRARAQAGLPKLENTPSDNTLQAIDRPTLAKIAYVQNPPSALGLRAQIQSGQQLGGTAKDRTVAVGRQLLEMGYNGIWQHPDFNYDSGYTGSGNERVGSHAANSYHKYNEALDIGVQANGHQKLEMLYQYLNKNRSRFGIAELFYDPDGSRGHPGDHSSHLHVSFGGGDVPRVGGPAGRTAQSTSQSTTQSSAPSGGKLTRDNVAAVMRQAGWNEADIADMSAVAMAESGGDSGIDTVQSGLDPNRSNEYSIGLFQINYKAHKPMLDQMGITEQDLRDPVTNAKVALKILQTQGRGAWGAYTNGSYRQFL